MNFYKNYWNKNLEIWITQYLDHTKKKEENFNTNFFVKLIYKYLVIHLERKATKKRLKIARAFLTKHCSKKKILNDIGCGSGLVTIPYIKRFKKINFIDFSNAAVHVLKKKIKKNIFYLDAVNKKPPKSDISICLGVTPYILQTQIVKFLNNILNSSEILMIHYLDKNNFFNYIRILFKSLNVRKVNFYSKSFLNTYYLKKNFNLIQRINFGTGFIDIISKKN
jgi:Trp operon repressor